MKLHHILIGVVLLGLVATAFYNFISVGVSGMSDPTSAGFDGTLLEELDTNANSVDNYEQFLNNETASADDENRNDILGAIFSRGYQKAKSGEIKNDLNRYGNLITSGTPKLAIILGDFSSDLSIALGLIVAIAIGVGLFLYFIIGKDRV